MRKYDINEVNKLVDEGYLDVQKHPTEDLKIYNYSNKTQYDAYWNPLTLACRGLILDSNGVVKASTFKKFFNHNQSQAEVHSDRPFLAYEKMDGSYIGTYWVRGELFLNSKGSFENIYVDVATKILNSRYAKAKKHMYKNFIYVFELIFPEGRIVCDYGDDYDLVLTAVFDAKRGYEFPLGMFDYLGFTMPEVIKYPAGTSLDSLQKENLDNKEGYVIRYLGPADEEGQYLRCKIKFDDYMHQHRIVTNVSSYDVWDAVRNNGRVSEEILDRVPDEFYNWVKALEQRLLEDYKIAAYYYFSKYHTIVSQLGRGFTRFDYIESIKKMDKGTHSLMLSILDLNFRSFKENLWKALKPNYEKPFGLGDKHRLQQIIARVPNETKA